jgi:hypothetical protein
MFMCRSHWFSLPAQLRKAIYRAYRHGQCDDLNPSKEYCETAQACILYIAKKEGIEVTGKEPELLLYEAFK